MKKATRKQSSSPAPLQEPIQQEVFPEWVDSPSPAIEVLVLDSNISFHGTLINKFTSTEYTITETIKGDNTWFCIKNDKLTLFVPIHRISYIIYSSVKQ